VVRVGQIAHGLRVYVAINGTLGAELVLGSVAPDRGLGIETWLARGDRLSLDTRFAWFAHPYTGIPLIRPPVVVPRFGSPWTIDVVEGPNAEGFADAMNALSCEDYEVTPQSDTVGLRLAGETPARLDAEPSEILSRGVAIGSVELASPGQLLVLMRGRMLTAGYAVLAIASRVAQSRLGQVRPGDTIRFRARSLAEAVDDARREAADLEATARAVRAILEESAALTG
jgi:allophanate hydrolase subunit 2